jgi:hypothetical protein
MRHEFLSGHDLVVLSVDWGRNPFSCQHLFKRVLPTNRIIWVNTVGYRSVRLTRYDLKRGWEKLANWFKGLGEVKISTPASFTFSVLNPLMFPFGRITLIRAFNARSVSRAILNRMRFLRFVDVVVIATVPSTADVIPRLPKKKVVYCCVDDFSQWLGLQGELTRAIEEKLLRHADLVAATSEKLQQTRSNGTRPTRLLTHGVDVGHFKEVAAAQAVQPAATLTSRVVALRTHRRALRPIPAGTGGEGHAGDHLLDYRSMAGGTGAFGEALKCQINRCGGL